ncbi:DUF4123 domain-containing protein [Celeribacter halophilus]|uniref:DUF4123 domain-containing protein n=1 Tax=Celeribacter halophilus TaxID=576117 RepID=UPI003A8E39C3
MAYFETWIAVLQIEDVVKKERHQCDAAVWASHSGMALHMVAEHLMSRGYRLCWADKCQPARMVAPADKRILTRVHEREPVVLGPIGSEAMRYRSHYSLTIEEIEDVRPLDLQRDVWPAKTVPDVLAEHIFGQPSTSDTDTEALSASAESQGFPLKTYAVLDAAKVFGLREILEASELNFRCLFKGEAEKDYVDAAPYLVELKEQSSFTRTLFTHLPHLPDNMTSRHLWHRTPGIYLRSRSAFDDVWTHFRKFTRIQDKHGKWYYFRFWEGGMLGSLLEPDTSSNAFVQAFVSGARIDIHSYIYQKDRERVFVARNDGAGQGNPSVIPLRYEDISSTLQAPAWQVFIKRLTEEFRKEFERTDIIRDDGWLADMCNFARRDGFKIELAIYNYVRSAHMAGVRNLSFYNLLNSLRGKHPTYSDLEISNLLWAAVQPT